MMARAAFFGQFVLRFVLWQFGSGKSGILYSMRNAPKHFFGAERVRIKTLRTWRVTKRLSVRKSWQTR
jgi:hypothetical protein